MVLPCVSRCVIVAFCRDVHEYSRRLILAFLTYFGLGAYYNYSTYGASGVDLIPYVFLLITTLSNADASLQTSGFLARSAVYGPRCRIAPLFSCKTPTVCSAGWIYRSMNLESFRERSLERDWAAVIDYFYDTLNYGRCPGPRVRLRVFRYPNRYLWLWLISLVNHGNQNVVM